MSTPSALRGWRGKPGRNVPVPRPRRSWRDRLKRPFGERSLLNRILWVGVGGFLLGYVAVTLLFFPGFGRSLIVTIPNLQGRGVSSAERALERLGLEAERGPTFPHPTVPAGAVLTHDPLAGQEVPRGATVRLILSAGPEQRAVPSVAGLPLAEARSLLERMGFVVTTRSVTHSAPEGRIVDLSPRAGTRVTLPETLTITLSSGPPKVVVPSVLALPEPEARRRLEAAGLRLGSVSYDPFASEALGGIARQSPAPGDSLSRGGAVSVVISGRGPDAPEPGDPGEEPAPEPPPEPARPGPPERG